MRLMKILQGLTAGLSAFLIAACGGETNSGPPASFEIDSDQFVVLPCGEVVQDRPCALVVAGGKRILFGAPTGAARFIGGDDLRQLDSVMLFSLFASDMEGLDEVRNASWFAGRSEPLRVVGPNGIVEVSAALDKAFEQSDALHVVENGIPPGGYDAALMRAVAADTGATVFDTGDLKVRRARGGYVIKYLNAKELWLLNCRDDHLSDESAKSTGTFIVSCDLSASDLTWPLSEPIFLKK